MPAVRVVSQGECLSVVAGQYGVPWRRIWHAPENADLRARRKTPDILLPGDVLHIPDVRPVTLTLATGAVHQVQIKTPRVRLRLHMRRNGQALGATSYVLVVGAETLSGKTGADGLIDVAISIGAKSAVLTLPDVPYKQLLLLGHLDPPDSVSGVQGRLQNLGAGSLSATGAPNEMTTQAVLVFQQANGLPQSGELDAATMAAVENAYGC